MSLHFDSDSEDGLTIVLKAFGPGDVLAVDQAPGNALPSPARFTRHS